MTREEAKHIVDVAFGVPQAVRRAGEDRTYHEKEIREAKDMAIKALEQEPCEDCISRKEVLEYIDEMPSELTADGRSMIRRRRLEEYISDTLPPVDPQPRMGQWQQDLDGTYLCSECGSGFKEQPTLMGKPMFAWCPLCGAKMQEGSE